MEQELPRFQKVLSAAGVASRRACEAIIADGRVTVNGQRVTTPGTKVDPTKDQIKLDGAPLPNGTEPNKVYVMLNKPIGYQSTVSDPHAKKTVMELVGQVEERIVPVGRLDEDSEGLLLLTNDGDFVFRLTHPRYHIPKVYNVRVKGFVEKESAAKLSNGVELDDGKTAPAEVIFVEYDAVTQSTTLEITLYEGRNRQIRRMLEFIGHPVRSLQRIAFGNIRLQHLNVGTFRKLRPDEVAGLLEMARPTPTPQLTERPLKPKSSRPPARPRTPKPPTLQDTSHRPPTPSSPKEASPRAPKPTTWNESGDRTPKSFNWRDNADRNPRPRPQNEDTDRAPKQWTQPDNTNHAPKPPAWNDNANRAPRPRTQNDSANRPPKPSQWQDNANRSPKPRPNNQEGYRGPKPPPWQNDSPKGSAKPWVPRDDANRGPKPPAWQKGGKRPPQTSTPSEEPTSGMQHFHWRNDQKRGAKPRPERAGFDRGPKPSPWQDEVKRSPKRPPWQYENKNAPKPRTGQDKPARPSKPRGSRGKKK